MSIYTFGCVKGGVGKTTLTLNVATYLANLGRKVLVLDTDDQDGVYKLVQARSTQPHLSQFMCVKLRHNPQAPLYVATSIRKMAEDYDDVVVDCPPGKNMREFRAATAVSDFLISPCQPSPIDLNTFEDNNNLIYDVLLQNPELISLAVLNVCSTNAGSMKASDAREALQSYANYKVMETEIKGRDSFREASFFGMGVLEYSKSTQAAKEDMAAFLKELLNV